MEKAFTFYIDEKLLEKVKIYCIKNKITMKQFITKAIEKQFKN